MLNVWRYLEPTLVQRLDMLQLTARSVVAGIAVGHRRSPLRGASIEFRQHRLYSPGDEIRRLDWRLLGRTDRPYVREYHEETNLRAVLLVDASGSMAYGAGEQQKLTYALRVAAALSYVMLRCGESVGVAVFDSNVRHWLPPQGGSTQLGRIFDVFDRAFPSGPGSPDMAIMQIAARLHRRSLVFLLTDLFAPVAGLRRALARLRYDRHEVIAAQVLHRDELEFPFTGFTGFHGLEAEAPSLGDSSLLRQTYLGRLGRHLEDVRAACRLLRVFPFRFVTDDPVDDAVIDFAGRFARGS